MGLKQLTTTLTLIFASVGATASTLDDLQDTLQFHGFATQSYIHTDNNSFFGDSEDGSLDFRELGVNSLWRPTPKLQFAIQVVSREAGETDDGDLRVDYAFVDYTLASTNSRTTGLRVGRVVNPYGFYNDTRDIASTRPSNLLPQSIYFDQNRNFALSSDGIHLYHEVGHNSGDYNFQIGVFEPRMEDPDFEPSLFGFQAPGRFEGDTSWMARLIYERDFGRIRLGLTAAEVKAGYDPAAVDPVQAGTFEFTPYILSAQYNRENWSLTAEYAMRKATIADFGFPSMKQTGESYFIQGTYRWSPTWETFLRYDHLIWDKNDRHGRKFQAATGLPAHYRFATDITLGVRWDILKNMMLTAEWHNIDGTGWLSRLENPNLLATDRYWNLFSFSASVRF